VDVVREVPREAIKEVEMLREVAVEVTKEVRFRPIMSERGRLVGLRTSLPVSARRACDSSPPSLR
jgi:hypothetical protein